jgi:hypothetical protein
MKFREHAFLYVLVLLILIGAGYSYFRFMVEHDYVVGYEGACDPAAQNCFVGCNNDDEDVSTCTDTYDYAKMQKYAVDLYAECGPDITDCADANVCLPQDRKCSVTYCDASDTDDTCSSAEAPSASDNDTGL